MQTRLATYSLVILAMAGMTVSGCGNEVSLFNRAFINTFSGGIVPVTPGPAAAFVFVRCVNETTEPVEFFVRVERRELRRDGDGNVELDALGLPSTDLVPLVIGVQTGASGPVGDVGVLFPCGESPVVRVGLGENYLQTDVAARVGGAVAGGASGFGIRVGNLNPLQLEAGNFNCGDTVIFRAFAAPNVAGGVSLQTFLLPGSEQPSVFQGPSTFANFEAFLDAQASQESP